MGELVESAEAGVRSTNSIVALRSRRNPVRSEASTRHKHEGAASGNASSELRDGRRSCGLGGVLTCEQRGTADLQTHAGQ